MKVILVVLSLISSLAIAGQENSGVPYSAFRPRSIYLALNVTVVDLNPGMAGSKTLEKAVGGLSCTRSVIVVPDAKPFYSCELVHTEADYEAIYNALRVKAVPVDTDVAGVGRRQKSVGGLVCTRSVVVYPGAQPSYACEMATEE